MGRKQKIKKSKIEVQDPPSELNSQSLPPKKWKSRIAEQFDDLEDLHKSVVLTTTQWDSAKNIHSEMMNNDFSIYFFLRKTYLILDMNQKIVFENTCKDDYPLIAFLNSIDSSFTNEQEKKLAIACRESDKNNEDFIHCIYYRLHPILNDNQRNNFQNFPQGDFGQYSKLYTLIEFQSNIENARKFKFNQKEINIIIRQHKIHDSLEKLINGILREPNITDDRKLGIAHEFPDITVESGASLRPKIRTWTKFITEHLSLVSQNETLAPSPKEEQFPPEEKAFSPNIPFTSSSPDIGTDNNNKYQQFLELYKNERSVDETLIKLNMSLENLHNHIIDIIKDFQKIETRELNESSIHTITQILQYFIESATSAKVIYNRFEYNISRFVNQLGFLSMMVKNSSSYNEFKIKLADIVPLTYLLQDCFFKKNREKSLKSTAHLLLGLSKIDTAESLELRQNDINDLYTFFEFIANIIFNENLSISNTDIPFILKAAYYLLSSKTLPQQQSIWEILSEIINGLCKLFIFRANDKSVTAQEFSDALTWIRNNLKCTTIKNIHGIIKAAKLNLPLQVSNSKVIADFLIGTGALANSETVRDFILLNTQDLNQLLYNLHVTLNNSDISVTLLADALEGTGYLAKAQYIQLSKSLDIKVLGNILNRINVTTDFKTLMQCARTQMHR